MAIGLLALLDDISTLMDDVATMSKVATEKTASVLGDDLAVNAEQASGFTASRELPVIWQITKGAFKNKLIILPLAFLFSAFASWFIIPALMMGGIYLAYEGMEKIYEYFFHRHEKKHLDGLKAKSKEEILTAEKTKIKSAILTDFILSIEIIVLALSTVKTEPMFVQVAVVTFVAIMATVAVYGIVALLVRMDDFGYKLIAMNGGESKIGSFFVAALPKVIKALTVIGTLAMLLVAGGIFIHNSAFVHHLVEDIPFIFGDLLVGAMIGTIGLLIIMVVNKVRA